MNIAKLKYYTNSTYLLKTTVSEIVADHKLILTSILQRRCRFNSETNLKHFQIYTEQLCIQECRLELVYKHCGCIPHFYPNQCDFILKFN